MTTAVADKETVVEALNNQCNYFIAKPIRKAKLMEVLRNLALIV
jgi:CheY-like chemotaxis protein